MDRNIVKVSLPLFGYKVNTHDTRYRRQTRAVCELPSRYLNYFYSFDFEGAKKEGAQKGRKKETRRKVKRKGGKQ